MPDCVRSRPYFMLGAPLIKCVNFGLADDQLNPHVFLLHVRTHPTPSGMMQQQPVTHFSLTTQVKHLTHFRMAFEESSRRDRRLELADHGLKHCGGCRTDKPVSAFNASKRTWDGKATQCAECCSARLNRWREANPNGFRRWHEQNTERRSKAFREWREKNKDRRAEYMATWLKANLPLLIARKAKRKAAKRRAAVAWANEEAMKVLYKEAARLTQTTGVRHEVDHFYPLQGELVCGLHCEANLQILTKEENIRKLNRMPEEFEGLAL